MVHVITPLICELLKGSVKEKVIRMGVSIFRNILESASSLSEGHSLHQQPHHHHHYNPTVVSALIGCRVLSVMEVLALRKFTDEEIAPDITFVKDSLSSLYQNLRHVYYFLFLI